MASTTLCLLLLAAVCTSTYGQVILRLGGSSAQNNLHKAVINAVGPRKLKPFTLNANGAYNSQNSGYGRNGVFGGLPESSPDKLDIGSYDTPLTTAQFNGFKAGGNVPVQFAGSVAGICVWGNGVGTVTKLTALQATNIYRGVVRNWSGIRPGASLPIKVYSRGVDTSGGSPVGSGSTRLFTTWLITSGQWPFAASDGTAPTWTVMDTANVIDSTAVSTGNLVTLVSATAGAIGYWDCLTRPTATSVRALPLASRDGTATTFVNSAGFSTFAGIPAAPTSFAGLASTNWGNLVTVNGAAKTFPITFYQFSAIWGDQTRTAATTDRKVLTKAFAYFYFSTTGTAAIRAAGYPFLTGAALTASTNALKFTKIPGASTGYKTWISGLP